MSFISLKITGKNYSLFIDRLYRNKIRLYDIKYIKDCIIIKINTKDYDKLLKLKTIYKTEIIKLYGLAGFSKCIKEKLIFMIVFTIGIIITIFLSNVCFSIKIMNENKNFKDFIYNELEKYNIKKYSYIKPYKLRKQIAEDITKNNKEKIEWIEIERIGIKYKVNVIKRKQKVNKVEEKIGNIIASKNGRIKKINATKGNVTTTINSYVKKGDVLISGDIMNKEKLMYQVHADGKVFAETWYKVSVNLPYHQYYEKNIGGKKRSIVIKWFNKTIILGNSSNYNEIKSNCIINNLVPIKIGIIEYNKINKIDTINSYDQAISKAHEVARKKLLNKLGNEDKIIYEKDLKIEPKNSKIYVEIFFKTIENIARFKETIKE